MVTPRGSVGGLAGPEVVAEQAGAVAPTFVGSATNCVHMDVVMRSPGVVRQQLGTGSFVLPTTGAAAAAGGSGRNGLDGRAVVPGAPRHAVDRTAVIAIAETHLSAERRCDCEKTYKN